MYQLKFSVKYKSGFFFTKKLRQNKKSHVEFEIMNKGNEVFPGATISDFNLSTSNRFGIVYMANFSHNTIPKLLPGEKFFISTAAFIVYFSEHCTFEIDVKSSDGKPIEIYLTSPISTEELQSKQNHILSSCFIESESSVANNRLAITNLLLSFVAVMSSLVALKISRDSQLKPTRVIVETQTIKEIKSINENLFKDITKKLKEIEETALESNLRSSGINKKSN